MTTHRLSILLFGVLALVGACGSSDTATTSSSSADPTTSSTATTTVATTTTTEATTTSEAPATTTTTAPAPASEASVYWGWTIDSIVANSPERLAAGGRNVDTPEAAMRALLDGPNAVESEIGMGTNIPAETTLLGLSVGDDGTATVDLSSAFEESGGTLGEFMHAGQVVFTLTQFDEVELVTFRIDGVDVEALGSHGMDVSDGLDRNDFHNIRALIMVEGPYPGSVVGDPFHITGESNTFEATVEYAVTDWEGVIIDEGFTTATNGNGTWGRFNIEVDVPDGTTGRGGIVVFETSARDGSQVNIVEYPIEFG